MTQMPHITHRVQHKVALARILMSKSTHTDTPHKSTVNQCFCHSPLSFFTPLGCPYRTIFFFYNSSSGIRIIKSKTHFQQAIISPEFLVTSAENLFLRIQQLLSQILLKADLKSCVSNLFSGTLLNNPANYNFYFPPNCFSVHSRMAKTVFQV